MSDPVIQSLRQIVADTYALIGHSERRQMFGETDEVVNKKARAVLAAGMRPIICVGETLEQREAGEAEDVVIAQVGASLTRLDPLDLTSSAIAYEPIWAIGTGRTASADDAGAMAEVIRRTVADNVASTSAEGIRILYGGSVNAANIKDIMAKAHVDGALVGGASLDPDKFASIVRYWI